MTELPAAHVDSELAAPDLPGRRRRLVFRLRRAARALERLERSQEWLLGAAFGALAFALPSAAPLGPDDVARRLAGEPVTTHGLLLPLARGLTLTTGCSPDVALRAIAATTFGIGLALMLGLLRGLGFRRRASVPATLSAFFAPVAWAGATSPSDFAPGVFASTALLASLLQLKETFPRDYTWRAILLLGLGTLLRPETVLLLPAVAWAVARHPARRAEAPVAFFSVFCVVSVSVAIGLRGPDEAVRVGHFVERTLAGAVPSARGWFAWPAWLLTSFGAALFGLYALLFARRDAQGQRAPRWVVPWCLVALAPMVVGQPSAGPVGCFLVPVMALGLADGLNRIGDRRREGLAAAALCAVQALLWALG